jgi:hypothetical protein
LATATRPSSDSFNPRTLFTCAFIGDDTCTACDAYERGIAVWTDFRGNPGKGAGRVSPAHQDTIVCIGH